MTDQDDAPKGLSDDEIEALRKIHGRVVAARYNGHDIVFRRPNVGEAQMYRTTLADTEDQRYERTANLAQFILVHPGLDVWNALLDDYPFMLSSQSVNDAIAKAMGVLEEKKDSSSRAKPSKSIPNGSQQASPTGSPSSPAAS